MVDAIQSKLGENVWLGGQQPSKEDNEQFISLNGQAPNAATHPDAFAWYTLVGRFSDDVRGSWTVAAPAAAAGVSTRIKSISLCVGVTLFISLYCLFCLI